MNHRTTHVLIHSPLVGPLTWTLVAEQMRKTGVEAVIPILNDSPHSPEAHWEQHADSVSEALAHMPKDRSLTLVAHSGAGPLLPAIRSAIPNPVHGYVFVDAGIPRDGATRLELMKGEDPAWAEAFEKHLKTGGHFPDWSMDDLRELIPDESLRRQMVAEIRPRGLSFFREPIPVFDGWPDAACTYIKFSQPYERSARRARELGWPVQELEAGHFHMLVDPAAVTDTIVDNTKRVSS